MSITNYQPILFVYLLAMSMIKHRLKNYYFTALLIHSIVIKYETLLLTFFFAITIMSLIKNNEWRHKFIIIRIFFYIIHRYSIWLGKVSLNFKAFWEQQKVNKQTWRFYFYTRIYFFKFHTIVTFHLFNRQIFNTQKTRDKHRHKIEISWPEQNTNRP